VWPSPACSVAGPLGADWVCCTIPARTVSLCRAHSDQAVDMHLLLFGYLQAHSNSGRLPTPPPTQKVGVESKKSSSNRASTPVSITIHISYFPLRPLLLRWRENPYSVVPCALPHRFSSMEEEKHSSRCRFTPADDWGGDGW
jgi:hypothetical protein